MQAPWWWSKTETCRSDIYVYFNVNFNVFFKIKNFICCWVNSTKASIQVKQIEIYKRISLQRFNTGNFRSKFLYLWLTFFLPNPPVITKKSCAYNTTCLLEFQADRNTSLGVVARLRATAKHLNFCVVLRPALGLVYLPIESATVEFYLW